MFYEAATRHYKDKGMLPLSEIKADFSNLHQVSSSNHILWFSKALNGVPKGHVT